MKNILEKTKIAAFGIIAAGGISYAFAWTGPGNGTIPPSANVSAPINVSSSTQIKYGNFILNGLSVNSATVLNGIFQINQDNVQPGEVLTAQDASGTAAWQAPAAGSSTSKLTFITPVTLFNQVTLSNGTITATLPASIPGSATEVLYSIGGITGGGRGNNYFVNYVYQPNSTSSTTYPFALIGAVDYMDYASQALLPISYNRNVTLNITGGTNNNKAIIVSVIAYQ